MEKFDDLAERQLDTRAIFDGKILHLRLDHVRLPNGKTAEREYLRHGGAVCVLPLLDDGTVLMERQYRYPMGQVMREIPAGKLDFPDEDPETAARRELREETGLVVTERDLDWLGVVHRNSDTNRIDFFVAVRGFTGDPEIREPDKCDRLEWHDPQALPACMVDYVRRALGAGQGPWILELGWNSQA